MRPRPGNTLRWSAPVVLTALLTILGTAPAIASSVASAVVDATAPTGSVTLAPGGGGTITINLTVTGAQAGTATFKIDRDWSLSGGAFMGSNAQTFTVGPRAGGDPALNLSTTGTVAVDSGQAPGTFALQVSPYDITNSNQTGGKLAAGSASTYSVTVAPPADGTPPVITPTVAGVLGTDDWYTTDVTVTFAVSDPQSAFTASPTCGATNAVTSDTNGVTFTCSASSAGGSSSQSVTVKRDATPPSILGSPLPDPNADGWNVGDVTIGYTCSDATAPGSGLATPCPAMDVVSGDGTHTISRSVTDAAGNTSTWSATVSIDGTAPVISGAPTTPANGNGWYASDVTVAFVCDDAGGSGVVSCGPDVTLMDDGAGQSATGTATDAAGNGNTATVSGINIDTTPPTIGYVGRTSPNPHGWNTGPVTVTWSCSDGLSGPVETTVEVVLPFDGAGQSATGVCIDQAGNIASDTVGDINIDQESPAIELADRSPSPNGNGWNDTAVTVGWTCHDEISGVLNDLVTQVASTEGVGQSLTGTCEDLAGNTAGDEVTGINIDMTEPVISGSRSPSPNANGWNDSDVLVGFDCADTGLVQSGIATDTVADTTVTSEGADQSVTSSGSCVDRADNAADAATVNGISIDKTAPSLVGAPTASPNAAGWYHHDVTIAWGASDALSGIDGAAPADATISAEGSGLTASASVSDMAGNTTTATSAPPVNIDKTAPIVSVTGVAQDATYTLGAVPVAGCSTADPLSGVKTFASVSIAGGPVGTMTATCTGAEDNAGNTASAQATYRVVFAWAGFFQPVDSVGWNSAKAGSSIPVKFDLGGNQGPDIFSTGYPVARQTACPGSSVLVDPIEEYAGTAGSSALTYDTAAHRYVYVWKTQKTYAGRCFAFDLGLVDGSSHTFRVQFPK